MTGIDELVLDIHTSGQYYLNCQGLIEQLGFQCREITDDVISVTTSFTFSDGEPIGFYLEGTGVNVRLTDNAGALVHAAAVGFDVSDRKKWKGIKQAVENWGLNLLDSGEVVGNATSGHEGNLFTRYIAAMLSVVDIFDQLGKREPCILDVTRLLSKARQAKDARSSGSHATTSPQRNAA